MAYATTCVMVFVCQKGGCGVQQCEEVLRFSAAVLTLCRRISGATYAGVPHCVVTLPPFCGRLYSEQSSNSCRDAGNAGVIHSTFKGCSAAADSGFIHTERREVPTNRDTGDPCGRSGSRSGSAQHQLRVEHQVCDPVVTFVNYCKGADWGLIIAAGMSIMRFCSL